MEEIVTNFFSMENFLEGQRSGYLWSLVEKEGIVDLEKLLLDEYMKVYKNNLAFSLFDNFFKALMEEVYTKTNVDILRWFLEKTDVCLRGRFHLFEKWCPEILRDYRNYSKNMFGRFSVQEIVNADKRKCSSIFAIVHTPLDRDSLYHCFKRRYLKYLKSRISFLLNKKTNSEEFKKRMIDLVNLIVFFFSIYRESVVLQVYSDFLRGREHLRVCEKKRELKEKYFKIERVSSTILKKENIVEEDIFKCKVPEIGSDLMWYYFSIKDGDETVFYGVREFFSWVCECTNINPIEIIRKACGYDDSESIYDIVLYYVPEFFYAYKERFYVSKNLDKLNDIYDERLLRDEDFVGVWVCKGDYGLSKVDYLLRKGLIDEELAFQLVKRLITERKLFKFRGKSILYPSVEEKIRKMIKNGICYELLFDIYGEMVVCDYIYNRKSPNDLSYFLFKMYPHRKDYIEEYMKEVGVDTHLLLFIHSCSEFFGFREEVKKVLADIFLKEEVTDEAMNSRFVSYLFNFLEYVFVCLPIVDVKVGKFFVEYIGSGKIYRPDLVGLHIFL